MRTLADFFSNAQLGLCSFWLSPARNRGLDAAIEEYGKLSEQEPDKEEVAAAAAAQQALS